MSTPRRIHHDLYRASKIIADPGTGGTITVTQDLQICEMVSESASETRTLTNPTKPGIRFVLRHLTDGGDITITSSNGFNQDGEDRILMDAAGDLVSLISVTHTTGYRWELLVNTSSVVPSATPSHTPSHTISHTPSHTVSHTPSHTPSHTISHTPSHTKSHTISHSPS